MGSINKPSAKPVTPGKIVIRKGEIEGPPYYWLHLNEPDFNLDELEGWEILPVDIVLKVQ